MHHTHLTESLCASCFMAWATPTLDDIKYHHQTNKTATTELR